MLRFRINGEWKEISDLDPATPLLWVLRDHLQLTGTRYGCGKGLCGSCTVHVDGSPVRACVMEVSAVDGKEITTIEGLAGKEADALRDAWRQENVPQCGFCQAGQLMSAEHQLRENPEATDLSRDAAMAGNICRCGTYPRIKKAMTIASDNLAKGDN